MKNTWFLSTLIICVLVSSVFAQQNFLPFQADYSAFMGAEGKSYTEVYVSVFQKELSYAMEGDVRMPNLCLCYSVNIYCAHFNTY